MLGKPDENMVTGLSDQLERNVLDAAKGLVDDDATLISLIPRMSAVAYPNGWETIFLDGEPIIDVGPITIEHKVTATGTQVTARREYRRLR